MYKLTLTRESGKDVDNLAAYMVYNLKNGQAAGNFLKQYDRQVRNLATFPFGYRGIGFEYQGYEIRVKPFSSYNIFFVVDALKHQVTILRVLKDRQNWKTILYNEDEYSF